MFIVVSDDGWSRQRGETSWRRREEIYGQVMKTSLTVIYFDTCSTRHFVTFCLIHDCRVTSSFSRPAGHVVPNSQAHFGVSLKALPLYFGKDCFLDWVGLRCLLKEALLLVRLQYIYFNRNFSLNFPYELLSFIEYWSTIQSNHYCCIL